jgi:enoyl-CoA hydratase/carnithine racemase
MSDIVETTVADGVYTIRLDNPDRGNALSRQSYRSMTAALEEAPETDARCVVVEGAGDTFCTGFDIEAMGSDDEVADDPDDTLDDHVEEIQANEHTLIETLITHELPTVAKIDGAAIGDGACVGLACDIPLASERARIGFSQARFALSMDCGGSYLLPRLVGRGMAMELALTGKVLHGDEAAEIGLVNHVYPDGEFEDRASELIDQLATGPPIAQKHIKRLIRKGSERDVGSALHAEATSQMIAGSTNDYDRAAEALRAGEEPTFEGN